MRPVAQLMGGTSNLLELDQRSGEVLGMQEQHRLPVRADLRLAGADDPGTGRRQPVARGQDIRHFVADVVDAAGGRLFEKATDRRALAQHAKQFDLGVRQGHLIGDGGKNSSNFLESIRADVAEKYYDVMYGENRGVEEWDRE